MLIVEHILKVLISSFHLHLQRRSDRNHEKLSQIARQVQVMSSRHGLTKKAAIMTAAARKLARGRVISGRGLHLDKVYCVLYQTFLILHLQDLIGNSPYCRFYISYDVSSENLVLNQIIIPLFTFFPLYSWLACLILLWYCTEKFGLGQSWELNNIKSNNTLK